MKVELEVNGTPMSGEAEGRTLLVYFIRDQLGLNTAVRQYRPDYPGVAMSERAHGVEGVGRLTRAQFHRALRLRIGGVGMTDGWPHAAPHHLGDHLG